METKHWIVAILVIGGLGYATGRYFQPAKVEVRVEERVKEVEVIKRQVRTIIKEVNRPDGTKEKETIIDERTDEERRRDSEKESSKIVTNEKPQWKVSAQLSLKQGPLGPVYGAQVERRILGPIFAGGFGNTDGAFGLAVGIEL